ncbi:MAG TPA: flagellar motor switch protein FliN [Planctomycetota bacterium]|nr:flagellar motor switch protein FliN [Planctomycetota bacterium]
MSGKESMGGEDTLEQVIDEATAAVEVQANQLDELVDARAEGEPIGIAHLMDVPVRVTVEVGRTRLTLAELIRIVPGSLVVLDREAHEPADILVNGKVVARGEVVTIDQSYGVRVTSVQPSGD